MQILSDNHPAFYFRLLTQGGNNIYLGWYGRKKTKMMLNRLCIKNDLKSDLTNRKLEIMKTLCVIIRYDILYTPPPAKI